MQQQRVFALESVVEISEGELLCSDSHPEFGVAYITKQQEQCQLVVNGTIWQAWTMKDRPGIWNMKISGRESVIAWNIPTGVARITPSSWSTIPTGAASNVLVSPNHIVVTYSEDNIDIADSHQLESNIASVFSHDGVLLLSLRQLLQKLSYQGVFMEVGHACATCEEKFYFLADATPHIWVLDMVKRTLELIAKDGVDDALAISADRETVHLLCKDKDQCVVRSVNLAKSSTLRIGLDRVNSNILLDRAERFKPIFGIAGGDFLTMDNKTVELLRSKPR
jgi:hypothetical protein